MDEALGFYNSVSKEELIVGMESYSVIVMFISLIFQILILIFVAVAILLIFSLLLIKVETKAFEYGVMRLVGLTKLGFVAMVLTQAVMFVLPALVLAFAASFPIIHFMYSIALADDLGYMPAVAPTGWATFNALFLGLVIPIGSSIIPIRRGLA